MGPFILNKGKFIILVSKAICHLEKGAASSFPGFAPDHNGPAPRSEWLHGGNTGETEATGKGLATLSHLPVAQHNCPFYQVLPST